LAIKLYPMDKIANGAAVALLVFIVFWFVMAWILIHEK
jgi:hypothetical protein